jgi:hypothetical protein
MRTVVAVNTVALPLAYFNQLEPPALIEHFKRHPPEGFVLLPGEAPAFEAPFDLLTTADDALRRQAAALPGYRRWSRWLRVRTAFVGTTVSEYALLPRASSAVQLACRLCAAAVDSHALTIVKDLPQSSPLLAPLDNVHADMLMDALVARGFIPVEGQALAYVPIDFPDLDAYLARLSTSRRKNLRRKLKSRAALDVRRVPTGEAFASDAAVDACYALYEAVHAQSEIHFDKLTREFFAAVLRDADSGGIVFEYRRTGAHELLGWNLCFAHDGKLIDKYIGLRYPAAREANLYFVSWMVNLEYAIERGLTHYVAGWTDPEVKAQLGASFTFTRHAVWVRNPLLRALGRRFAGRFESDRAWHDGSA